MFFVYILFCCDKRLYIGFSANLKRRLSEHQNGLSKSTKFRRPLKLIYYECYTNKADAKAREIFLKSGAGHEQLKHQHKRMFAEISYKHAFQNK